MSELSEIRGGAALKRGRKVATGPLLCCVGTIFAPSRSGVVPDQDERETPNGPIANKRPVRGLRLVHQAHGDKPANRGRRICQGELAQVSAVGACWARLATGPNRRWQSDKERQREPGSAPAEDRGTS